jgi:hypothetical protein
MSAAPGTLLLPPDNALRPVPAILNRLDPRAAMAAALAGYLRCAVFLRWGAEAQDVRFKLNEVLEEWPDPKGQLNYPAASIVDAGPTPMQQHNHVPTALEDTLDAHGEGTVLWKLAEAEQVFQVDFWAINAPDREAIAAGLPGLFSPGENTARAVLAGHPAHFCIPVRASLDDYQRMDTADAVYESERRLLARIRCSIDVVELRCGTLLAPSVQVNAGEQVEV